MNYKKITQIQSFGIVTILGIMIDHDSYQVFLAISSAIVAYFLARLLFPGKGARSLFFTFTAIAICQLSVVFKRAVMETGFKQAALENPTGYLLADVMYGFRHVITTVARVFGAFAEVIGLDKYSSIESLNYRFSTMIIMIVVMTVFILKERIPATTDVV